MNKNRTKIFLSLIAVTGFVLAAYFYFESIKNKKKITEVEKDKLKILLDSLKRNADLSQEIKLQLEKLILEFRNVDEKVSNELVQALQLFQIGQIENSIEDLVKIIEHLLNVHYKDDPKYKKWLKNEKKKHDLHNSLAYCKHEKKIDEIEFHFFIAIKVIRNKEDHTLDIKLDNYLSASGLITAVGGIFKIASIVYPKQKVNELPSISS